MKAVIYNDINDYKVKDDIREPEINDILNVKIKVKYCGICGSDIHKLLYEKPDSNYVKTKILGHEITGVVIEKKTNVKKVNIGDMVVIEPLLYCGKCEMCKEGHVQFCKNIKSLGKDFGGGFAEYIVANEKQVYKIDKKENLKISGMTDPYSVALHTTRLIKNKKVGLKIGIIGDGIIAIACADFLSNRNQVTIIGKHDNRKSILSKINVNYVDTNIITEKVNYFDVVIETVGGRQSDTLEKAIKICKPKGEIIVVGVYDNNFKFDISLRESFYKELAIVGCNSFETINGISEFKYALDYLNNKSKIANELVSKTFEIDDFEDAIEYIKNRKQNNCIKIMIRM